jgi:hypothetical protein
VDLDAVDTVLVYALYAKSATYSITEQITHVWGTQDGAIPVRHEEIISVVETV